MRGWLIRDTSNLLGSTGFVVENQNREAEWRKILKGQVGRNKELRFHVENRGNLGHIKVVPQCRVMTENDRKCFRKTSLVQCK